MARQKPKDDSIAFRLPKFRIPAWAGIVILIVGIGAVGGLFTAAKIEENDAFCASCHTEPEATFYNRSLDITAVDLASFHHSDQQTRCIDCHSGAGVPGRISGITMGAYDLVSYMSGQAPQPAKLRFPIADQNCTKCHTDTTSAQDFRRHFHAFLPQWQQIDPNAGSCVDCHPAHATSGIAAEGYLIESEVVQVCQDCHTVAGEGGE